MLTGGPQRFSKTRLTGRSRKGREGGRPPYSLLCPSHPFSFSVPPVYGAKSLAKKDLLSESVGNGRAGRSAQYRGLSSSASYPPPRSYSELPDPFAKVVVEDTGQCHATDVQKGTLDPKWNHHFDL